MVGVIGKEVRWDELLKFKCDIDWHEKRFWSVEKHDKNLGGNPTPLGQVECSRKRGL